MEVSRSEMSCANGPIKRQSVPVVDIDTELWEHLCYFANFDHSSTRIVSVIPPQDRPLSVGPKGLMDVGRTRHIAHEQEHQESTFDLNIFLPETWHRDN